jgi:peptidyl-prolyl cis-trans isomerase D
MPLMTKIRESLATFFSIFAGLFVIYIVLDWGMDITGRRHSTRQAEAQEIGKINDKPILAKDFADLLRRATDNQKAQTGTEPDENQQRMIRDQIWNQLVDEELYNEEISRLGITVTDQEIIDWVKGENPPEFLRQRFTDSTGKFMRQEYDAAIMDPKNKSAMANVEDFLRKQRAQEKLQSLILASVQVDEYDVRQKFADQNVKYEADYVLFDPNVLVRDDEVKLQDDDLKKYYNDHSDDYKVEATRKLKYVLFSEIPSGGDTTGVVNDMADIKKRALAGADFRELAKTYSDVPPKDSIFSKHGEMAQPLESALYAAKPGDIVGPVIEPAGYHLAKVIEFRPGKDEVMHASHILISIQNNDSVKALQEAKDILAAIKGGADFAELARTKSTDRGSAVNGGDVGWFGKGRMVKPFEDAVQKAKPGQIVGPVRTPYGYHIIKVIAKDNREVRYTDILMPVRMSAQTRNDISQAAQDFAYVAKQGSFEKEAEQSKYRIVETPPFQKSAPIPGIGTNNAANKFAFDNSVNSVSASISLTNGYAVFKVSEVKDAGLRPFDEVKTLVESRLRHDRKMDKVRQMAADIRKSLSAADNLAAVSAKNPTLAVQHLAPTVLSGYLPGIGRDPGFLGGLTSLNAGDISNPIDGARGVYLIKLASKSAFDSTAYTSQRDNLRSQLLSERRNRFLSEWTDHLKKSADIVDNRDMFYR